MRKGLDETQNGNSPWDSTFSLYIILSQASVYSYKDLPKFTENSSPKL